MTSRDGRFARRGAAAAMAALVCAGAAPAPAGPGVTVVLKPAALDAAQHVPSVEVTITAEGLKAAAGQPLLRLAKVFDNVETVAGTLEDLTASDAAGPLKLSVSDDPDGPQPYRHWTADRPVSGPLTVRYRVPITNALNPRGAAPPFELRSDGGAFSGAGMAFLVLPETKAATRLAVRWDLSALPAGAAGVSSFGPGDATVEAAGPIDRLDDAFFMGGLAHRYPERPLGDGFFSAWQGAPPFDGRALMAWTDTLYRHYTRFFRVGGAPPYGVFLRPNLINAGGGVELAGSFVGTFGPKTKEDEFRLTLAHEMLHTFVRGLDSPSGLAGSWFSEGIAVYYERELPLRFSMLSPEGFLKDLNTTAGRYYTDLLNTTPNQDIPAGFWADTRIRVLPYDRGALYFATVDGEVRRASHGRRGLDDLILAMIELRRHGQPMDEAAWRRLIRAELGQRGEDQLDAMLAGKLVRPAPGDFGPCFRRTTATLRRYELGFDPKVLIEPQRIVRGLVPGSAAQTAGLRDGDQIVRPVPQDGVQADQQAQLKLLVRRDGKVFEISYLPRGEAVDVWQWARVPGVPDSACAVR